MTHPDAPPLDIAATLAELGAQVLVRGWLSANNIVFAGAQACVVDTGYVSHAAQTVALLEQALAGADLERVINTHLHSDHCGGNASLARRWPAVQIQVPLGYRRQLEPWDHAGLRYADVDQDCEPFTPHGYLQAGDGLRLGPRDWQVLAAPGHAPDALLFFEPVSRCLISGDALWQDRLAIIFPELDGEPGFDATAQVLDQIEALAPRLVLPGHGQPFTAVAAALSASRQRLAAFSAAPIKHHQHAARALITYHLLAVQRETRAALLDWIVRTPIFRRALACEHDDALARVLAAQSVDRLLRDGVLALQGEQLVMAQR